MKKRLTFSSKVIHCINVGVVDRLLRLFLGVACLAYLYISHYLLNITSLSLVLALASIYPILTAWVAWDPIYEFLSISTKRLLHKDTEVEGSNILLKDKPINNDQQEFQIRKNAA